MEEYLNYLNKTGFLRAQNIRGNQKRFITGFMQYDGERISHYTDLNGLYGIVESGGLWLSDHRFLNDTEEFENGRKLTINIINKLITKKRYAVFNQVLEKTLEQLQNYKEPPYFVCSFSKTPDSLDQWRSYASNGQGISITFNNSQSLSHFSILPVSTVKEVIYKDREKIKLLLSALREHRREYIIDQKLGNPIDMNTWSEELAMYLALAFINFKHPEYSSEQEVRMIVPSSRLGHFEKVNHRVAKGQIIPYVTSSELYDEHFKKEVGTNLPITEIRVGPTSNQDITAKSIEVYLANKGYKHVKVLKSEVPYRG